MRADGDKVCRVFGNYPIDDAKIAPDVDAPVSVVFATKRVVVQQRVEGVAQEDIASLLKFIFLISTKRLVLFLEMSMNNDVHFASRYLSISAPEVKAGEIFLWTAISRSA